MAVSPVLRCRIRVKGQLAPEWSAWFDGLAVTPEPNGQTTISGRIPDQAALHGLLAKVRDLGLSLVSASVEEQPVASGRRSRRSRGMETETEHPPG